MNSKAAYMIQCTTLVFVLLMPCFALGMNSTFFDICIKSPQAQAALKADILSNAKNILAKNSKNQYKIESDYEREDRIVEKIIKKHNLIALKNERFDIKSRDAANLLYYALYHSFHDGARWLLQKGVDPNLAEETSANALHVCVGTRALYAPSDIIESLIQHNVPINAKNLYGKTPLHLAVLRANQGLWELWKKDTVSHRNSIVDMLLRSGANPTIEDESQKTPLYYAADKGNMEAVYLFVKHGAQIDFWSCKHIISELTELFPILSKNSWFVLDDGRYNKLQTLKEATKIACVDSKIKNFFFVCMNRTDLQQLVQQRDVQILSLLDDWNIDIAQSGLDLSASDKHGKTFFHDIILLEKPDIKFFKRLLHAYNVDCSILHKKNNNGNTFFHLLVNRTGINIFKVCEKLYTINKPGKPSGSQVAILLLMMHKRKDSILSVMPRKLLIHLINRFGHIWNDENSILSKELLSIQNKKGQTAYDSFIEMINGMEMTISISKESGIMSEKEHEKVLKIAEAYYQEESNNQLTQIKKRASILLDPSRRN